MTRLRWPKLDTLEMQQLWLRMGRNGIQSVLQPDTGFMNVKDKSVMLTDSLPNLSVIRGPVDQWCKPMSDGRSAQNSKKFLRRIVMEISMIFH